MNKDIEPLVQVREQKGTSSFSSKKHYRPHNESPDTQAEHADGEYRNVGYRDRLITALLGGDSSCTA